jgi:chromosome segregation ATPase
MEINIRIVSEGEVIKLIHNKLDSIMSSLSGLHYAVNNLTMEVMNMTVELDALEAQVEQNTTVEGSAMELIQGLADQFEAVKNDPARISALVAKLKGSGDALVAKVVANTPAAPGNTPAVQPTVQPV